MSYYKKHIFVCENQRGEGERPSCGASNSQVLKYLKQKIHLFYKGEGKIRVQRAGCFDRCEEVPVFVSYPEGHWFRLRSLEDADRFLEFYIGKGERDSIKDLLLEG